MNRSKRQSSVAKENIAPPPRPNSPYRLRPRKEIAEELAELSKRLTEAEEVRDELICREHGMHNRVVGEAEREMREYLEKRYHRLKNGKLEYSEQTAELKHKARAELDAKLEQARERIRKAKQEAKRDQQMQGELEQVRQVEAELEQSIARKKAILKALADTM